MRELESVDVYAYTRRRETIEYLPRDGSRFLACAMANAVKGKVRRTRDVNRSLSSASTLAHTILPLRPFSPSSADRCALIRAARRGFHRELSKRRKIAFPHPLARVRPFSHSRLYIYSFSSARACTHIQARSGPGSECEACAQPEGF